MPVTTTIEPTAAPALGSEEPTQKGKRKLLILVVCGLLVGAAGYYQTIVKPAAAKRAEALAVHQPGAVENLGSSTVNLSDGHFLKVGLALQLTKAAGPSVPGAQALDAAVSVFGSRTYSQLLPATGRARAVAQLSSDVVRRYPDKVMKVYLTEFVMQ